MLAVLLVVLAAGPLGLRTQGPLRELFLDVTIADARPISRPELDVRYSVANSWNEPMLVARGDHGGYQALDEQADALTVRLRWPLTPRVWTALEWKATEHWGGWTDRPIELWHGLIGSFNYLRESYPRNAVNLVFRDDGGTAFDLHSATFAVGDATVRTQATLLAGEAGAVAARLDVKVPIGALSVAGGSGGWDAGAGVVATWVTNDWLTLHALAALSVFSHLAAPTLLQPKRWHTTGEVSAEFKAGDWTLLLEDRCVSPLLAPGWERAPLGDDDSFLSSGWFAGFRAHNQISGGARIGHWSFWASEDFTPGYNAHAVLHWLWVSNAPDFVFGAAYTRSF